MRTKTTLILSLYLTALALALSACAFSKGQPEPEKPVTAADTIVETIRKEQEKEVFNGQLTHNNVSVIFNELPDPNSYKMIVRWPKAVPKMEVIWNGRVPSVFANIDHAEFSVVGDENQTLQLVAHGTISSIPLSTIEVTARSPKDFAFRDVIELKENTVYQGNRMFFEPGAQLRTNGFDLTINVNKLYVRESDAKPSDEYLNTAHIRTVALGTVSDHAELYTGSKVTIRAREATGSLRFAMIGFDGKTGKSGTQIEAEMKTPPSRQATPPAAHLQGTAGHQTNGHQICDYMGAKTARNCYFEPAQCIQQPGTGAPGGKGRKGTQGGRGGTGGDAGQVFFDITLALNFEATIRYRAGSGGDGGKGADGFPGDLGGLPGSNPGACNSATSGSQGAPGDQGAMGFSGTTGEGVKINTGPSSIRVDSKELSLPARDAK